MLIHKMIYDDVISKLGQTAVDNMQPHTVFINEKGITQLMCMHCYMNKVLI